MSGIYNHNSKRHCGSVEQNALRGKVSNAIEQAKRLFDSLCTIIWIEARNIYVKMNRLSQHSSVGKAAVAVIKIAVILFMIIVAVETLFHVRSYFWLLCGYLSSLLCFAFVAIVKGADMILMNLWVTSKYVFHCISKIFVGSITVAIYCLKPIMVFALNGVFTFLRYLIISFLDWALNLRIDWRSFGQLCFLCGIMKMVMLWGKHATRFICSNVYIGVKEAKRHFDSSFAVCSAETWIIIRKMDRLSGRCKAKMMAILIVVILLTFTVTNASVFPSRHSVLSMCTHLLHLTETYLVSVWKNMVLTMDNFRVYVSMNFGALTSFKLSDNICVIMENVCWFISKVFEALNSIVHSFLEWMALLASYGLTVSCYLLKLFSVVLFSVWKSMIVILDNLRMFIPKLFEALNSIAHRFLEWLALLGSYCLSVSYYLLELFSVVLVSVRENMVVILDNLRMFILKLFEALNGIAHCFLEWMRLLASYCLNVSCYLLELFSVVRVSVQESMFVILDNLRMFIPKLFEVLNSIAHRFLEWLALLASYCLSVSYYLLELFSVVLVSVRENMVVILDNLRMFILKLFEALHGIAHSFLEWMALLASHGLNVSYYLLELFSVVLVCVRESMFVILDNLHMFILKFFEALNSFVHGCLEYIAVSSSYCLTFSSYLAELFSAVLVRVWENMVVIMDNLRMFVSIFFDTLISIRYWENSCAILENLRWLISEIFEASNRFAHGCSEWIVLLVSYCSISLCYLLEWFSVVLVSIWENTTALMNNMRMFLSIIFEVLTSVSYWENLCLFISKISAALTSVTHGCLGWINLLAPCVQTVPSYLPKSFSNGAINLTNYWGNFSLLGVLCGAVIIWRCCFRAVLRKESLGEAGHIHEESPAVPICLKFLLRKCSEGTKCPEHHCFLPYHWQYNVSSGVEWKSFSEKDNLALEKLYCDVNVEGPVKLNLAQAIASDGKTLPPWECEVSIDVNSMTLSIKPTAGICTAGYGSGKLRRFATPPCSTNPSHPLSTNWKWYWEDNGGVWCMYEKDHLGRNLQELIEQAFVKGLKRNETDYTFNFKVKAHKYYLVFHSEKGMHQINMQYGTKRKVKRRPERLISPEEMTFFKRVPSKESVLMKEPEKRAVESPVPSHWSYTPASEPYTRVTLDSSSWEFKKVEQLFIASMSNMVIKKIDRVQNLFMWEKYRRKKDYMTQLANGDQQRVNEKRLFHGTSPDSVKAICKENFDWRLRGTATGTKYGQGSYFAVKASYSHNYAREDANKSRFMFVAKVLVGSYVKGNPSYRRPPHKLPLNGGDTLYYDSCVDDVLQPNMFIVFDIDQLYPEYIIHY